MATITINQGDDITISLDFDTDITGATVYFMAKYRKSDADGAAAINESQASHTDASAGQTTITLTDEETAAISLTPLYWQTWVVDSGGGESSADSGIMDMKELLR